MPLSYILFFFFFNDTATTEIYTLSLHDALPIYRQRRRGAPVPDPSQRARHRSVSTDRARAVPEAARRRGLDRKSTRLNSSHANISYAVFCLKKKNNKDLKEKERVGYFPLAHRND